MEKDRPPLGEQGDGDQGAEAPVSPSGPSVAWGFVPVVGLTRDSHCAMGLQQDGERARAQGMLPTAPCSWSSQGVDCQPRSGEGKAVPAGLLALLPLRTPLGLWGVSHWQSPSVLSVSQEGPGASLSPWGLP